MVLLDSSPQKRSLVVPATGVAVRAATVGVLAVGAGRGVPAVLPHDARRMAGTTARRRHFMARACSQLWENV
jgi:hypothetical protein